MSVLKPILRRLFFPAGKPEGLPDIVALRAQQLPTDYWIELTSRCPFHCVFCSRESVRGRGEHMDYSLYERLVRQMKDPAVIRLNYSGESIHYPKLADAIRLAKSTGARVELVTALSSARPDVVAVLAKEGLDRLTISIHALEEPLYQAIYGYGSVDALRGNLALLQVCKERLNHAKPVVDIAFVAMERNLSQLVLVAALASELKIQQIDVHPVIRRDEIPESFSRELLAGSLTPGFRQHLSQALEQTGRLYPEIRLNVSNKELEPPSCLGKTPVVYPAVLPEGAKIHTCDQNPWETIHVLASGDLVTCEVRDRIVMGNLNAADLADIWNSRHYAGFRRGYASGRDETCRICPYKQAYQPEPGGAVIQTFFKPEECRHQLIQGWHEPEQGFVWSAAKSSRVIMARPGMGKHIRITGILPPGPESGGNELGIAMGSRHILVNNSTRDMLDFAVEIPLESIKERTLVIDFRVLAFFSPDRTGQSADARQLGFVLSEILCL